jgi:hypothetical protein
MHGVIREHAVTGYVNWSVVAIALFVVSLARTAEGRFFAMIFLFMGAARYTEDARACRKVVRILQEIQRRP